LRRFIASWRDEEANRFVIQDPLRIQPARELALDVPGDPCQRDTILFTELPREGLRARHVVGTCRDLICELREREVVSLDLALCTSMRSIAQSAACRCRALRHVVLPPNITVVERDAFDACSSLVHVDFSRCTALKELMPFTFYGCKSLVTVDLRACTSLHGIWEHAFGSCCELQSVHFPVSLRTVSFGTFGACASLASVDFSRCLALANVIDFAFSQCTSLVTVDLGACKALDKVGASAFSSCRSLECVVLPPSMQVLGSGAFSECAALVDVDMTRCSALRELESCVFLSCSKLVAVDIRACVALRSIGESAFSGCASLSTVLLPPGLEVVRREAFHDCVSLTHIDFSQCAALKELQVWAFVQTPSLTTIDLSACASLHTVDKYAFEAPSATAAQKTVLWPPSFRGSPSRRPRRQREPPRRTDEQRESPHAKQHCHPRN